MEEAVTELKAASLEASAAIGSRLTGLLAELAGAEHDPSEPFSGSCEAKDRLAFLFWHIFYSSAVFDRGKIFSCWCACRTGAARHEPIEQAGPRRQPANFAAVFIKPKNLNRFVMAKITFIDSGGTAAPSRARPARPSWRRRSRTACLGSRPNAAAPAPVRPAIVYIDEAWREKVGEPSPMEEDMLDFAFEVKPNSRLSCQIKVRDELDGLVVADARASSMTRQAMTGSGRRAPRIDPLSLRRRAR